MRQNLSHEQTQEVGPHPLSLRVSKVNDEDLSLVLKAFLSLEWRVVKVS